MAKRLKRDLYACGGGLPEGLSVGPLRYRHARTFKHDFFAATGYYEPVSDAAGQDGAAGRPLVLKINRKQSFLGIPLNWLGRGLQKHELDMLRHLQDVEQVPKVVDCWGSNGFLYEYIEGRSLDERPEIPDSFFDELESLLDRIHEKNVCYIDLNKRGNILVGKDGRPYLIDFQISMLAKRRGLLCRLLQREDRYHLFKHKRRFRPDLMSDAELKESRRKSFWIHLHRVIAGPFRFVRRRALRWLYEHEHLNMEAEGRVSPENDPRRFGGSRKS